MTGCIIDGSHAHPDDFSMQVIQYAQLFGYDPEQDVTVAILLRSTGLGEEICSDEGQARMSEALMEGSDDAVNWLNENVVTGAFAFYVEESDLFLSPASELEASSEDDGPWKYGRLSE